MKNSIFTLFLAGTLVCTGCSSFSPATDTPSISPPPVADSSENPSDGQTTEIPAESVPADNIMQDILNGMAQEGSVLQYTDAGGEVVVSMLQADRLNTIRLVFQQYAWRTATLDDIPENPKFDISFENNKGDLLALCSHAPFAYYTSGGVAAYYVYDIPEDSTWHTLDTELLAMLESRVPFFLQYTLRELGASDTAMVYKDTTGKEVTVDPSNVDFSQIRDLFHEYDWLEVPQYYDPSEEVLSFFVNPPNGRKADSLLALSICSDVQMAFITSNGIPYQYLFYIPDGSVLQTLDTALLALFE